MEVVTWGRPDWTSAREWRSLEPHLSRFDPDLLLLAYCLNNTEPIDEGRRALLPPYYDPHPSRLAHSIGARAILGYLEEHQLLPRPEATGDRPFPTNDSLPSRSRRTP